MKKTTINLVLLLITAIMYITSCSFNKSPSYQEMIEYKKNKFAKYVNSTVLRFTLQVPDTVSDTDKDIPVLLKFENLTSDIAIVADPRCWCNVLIIVEKKGIKAPPGLIIHGSLECCNDTIIIKGGESRIMKYPTALNYIVSIQYLSTGLYDIYCKYDYPLDLKSEVSHFYKK